MREGYKNTVLGEIPEDWEVVKLGDILKIGSGKDYKHLGEGKIPVYGTGGYMTSVDQYLYDGESVGIGRKGTIDKPVYLTGKFWTVDTLFFTHSFDGVIPYYTYLLFQSINWRKYNEATGVPSLSKVIIEKIQVGLPTISEQKKIAEILSTVDEKIDAIEQQIVETSELKKGLMQKLLTKGIGHTKFKDSLLGEIPESWEVVKLGEVTNIMSSNVDKKIVEGEEKVRLCNYMDVYNSDYIDSKLDFMEASASLSEIDKFRLCSNDVIITKDSETKEDIAQATVVIEDFKNVLCGYHLSLIRADKDLCNGVYLSKLFSISVIRKQLINKANGTTRFGLNVGTIENLQIPLPPLPEQKQISQILSTVDEKLDVLRDKKAEYQEMKKGLMQQLLTGKVRVKVLQEC